MVTRIVVMIAPQLVIAKMVSASQDHSHHNCDDDPRGYLERQVKEGV